MLDDLRNSAIQEFPEDEEPLIPEEGFRKPMGRMRSKPGFLGMTAVQRFIVATLLLLMTCVMGMLCLVMTGRVWI